MIKPKENPPPRPKNSRNSRTKWGPRCEHPIARHAGMCKNASIGEFDIPPEYVPPHRHVNQPQIRRPKAFLCLQHSVRLNLFKEGKKGANAGSHESQCMVCQHPRGKQVTQMWVEWAMNATEASIELGVANRVFISHIDYLNLYERKARKVNTRRALVMAAERGFRSGGDSATTALRALEQIRKEAGDTADANVNVQLSVSDLATMTDQQLALYISQLGTALQAKVEDNKELPAGPTAIDAPVIDVPYTVVEDAADKH